MKRGKVANKSKISSDFLMQLLNRLDKKIWNKKLISFPDIWLLFSQVLKTNKKESMLLLRRLEKERRIVIHAFNGVELLGSISERRQEKIRLIKTVIEDAFEKGLDGVVINKYSVEVLGKSIRFTDPDYFLLKNQQNPFILTKEFMRRPGHRKAGYYYWIARRLPE